ncbi:FHA domain-containing protein [Aureibaculum algae]|uniref:FHA domain-containing protein n=1 Tax=Aureibaculum algae TaxID=2584122 RepID=A0A5B7TSZ8_9FLAO|nr:FHA domain-containing protein [Aureibaculum algae]QCX38343.1 FHA domain-containing protein [Aureibaculum algae]
MQQEVYLKIGAKTIALAENQKLLIGRKKHGADIEIDDPSVGRKHATIENKAGKIYIKDLESLNGTYVNDKRIESNKLIEVSLKDKIKVVSESIEITLKKNTLTKDKSEKISKKDDKNVELNDATGLKQKITSKGFFNIGRLSENDIVLDDRVVSRKHAKISFENGNFWIENLRLKNKTYLNGHEVKEKTRLRDTDVITISFYSIDLLNGLKDLRKEHSAIEAIGIQKKYPNNKIGLQSLSLNIPQATFVALMGPSGCGKSTLLKCLNGDNPATSGEVLIHGLSLEKNFNLIKKKIGYVPQDDIIHKELTVYKTLFYAGKLRLPDDTSDEEINNRINRVISSLNLDQDKEKDIRGIKVGSLSGGQRKRISIAVELLTEPTILFLDEPTSPLDPETIESFLTSLRELTKEGTTIVMVTHKPEDLNYVDQVIFLGVQGHLTFTGPANSLISKFEVNNIVEVYTKTSDLEQVLKNYYIKSPEVLYQKESIPEIKREKPDSLILQLYWLISRYFKIKINDRENLILLFAQPLIIGGLVSLVFNELSIGVFFMIAISAVWFGVSNASKEIVGELAVYRRERMYNLNINTYIISKCVVLSMIALIQTIIFISIVYLNFKINTVEGHSDTFLRPFWQSVGFMFYLSFSATLMGLFLSSYFNTTEKVMTVVPIALMPQIMLAGVMTRIDNTLVELLSFTTLGRWGTEGFARIQDKSYLDAEMESKSILLEVTQGNDIKLVGSKAMKRLDLYNENLVENGTLIGSVFDSFSANLLMIAALNLVVYLLIYYALKRKDSI